MITESNHRSWTTGLQRVKNQAGWSNVYALLYGQMILNIQFPYIKNTFLKLLFKIHNNILSFIELLAI